MTKIHGALHGKVLRKKPWRDGEMTFLLDHKRGAGKANDSIQKNQDSPFGQYQ